MFMDQKDYLTAQELANILDLSRVSVFKRIQKGQIKAEKIGRNYIIFKKDLVGIINHELSERMKREIKDAVTRVLTEYGDTIKMLGKE